MTKPSRFSFVSALATVALVCMGQEAKSQEPVVLSIAAGYAVDVEALRQWDATVDSMARTGDLIAVSRRSDASLEGRTHEYLAQHYAGIPVFGGGVSRQLDAGGVTVSLFGTVHQDIEVDATPALSGARVTALLEQLHGGDVVAGGQPSLGILPLFDGSYALTYVVPMSDRRFYFADAHDGQVLHTINASRTQSAIGAGAGTKGDRKKLGTIRSGDRFEAHDMTRPAEIVTLDARFNVGRLNRLVDDHMLDGLPEGQPIWTADDIAADADNEWDDTAIVDVHAHTGWTYDYFAQRHGWEGLDGENGRILSIANIGIRNAFFFYPPYGPEGTGVMAYGRGEFPMAEEPWTNLDTVGHEMMHGVTAYAVIERTGSEFGLFNDLSPAGGAVGSGRRASPIERERPTPAKPPALLCRDSHPTAPRPWSCRRCASTAGSSWHLLRRTRSTKATPTSSPRRSDSSTKTPAPRPTISRRVTRSCPFSVPLSIPGPSR